MLSRRSRSQQPFPFDHDKLAPIERLPGGGTRVVLEGEGQTVGGSLSFVIAMACLLALMFTPIALLYRPLFAFFLLIMTLGLFALYHHLTRPMPAIALERQLVIEASPEGLELLFCDKRGCESRQRFWPAEKIRTIDASGPDLLLKLRSRRSVRLATLDSRVMPERVVLALLLGQMRCLQCNYDLRAGPAICPECGSDMSPLMSPSSRDQPPIMPTVQ